MTFQNRPPLIALVIGALAVAACDSAPREGDRSAPDRTLTADAPPPVAVDTIPSPAGAGSGEPNLAVGPDGFYLSWLERTGESRHALRFARWEDSAWSSPGTVMERSDLFVNWADFPAMVVLEDGTLAAHWLEKSGPGTYSYDVRMAVSRDGGVSWSEDIIPHRDGLEAEHGFVDLFPVDGRIGAVWLDGRETVKGDPMTVRFTTLAADGTLGEEELLDASACDCCQTSAANSSQGPVVVYRDRTPEEVRDIYITRRVDGEWTEGQAVHDDGWVIPGCPVNGPSVDAAGSRVAVAWFTAAPEAGAANQEASEADRAAVRRMGENGRVLIAFSDDAGASFGEPVRVDDGQAMGRVSTLLLDDGTALVAWLERTAAGAEVRIRQVAESGGGASLPLAATAAERASGFPRMARMGDRLMFAWTEPGENARVRTALGRLGAAARESD